MYLDIAKSNKSINVTDRALRDYPGVTEILTHCGKFVKLPYIANTNLLKMLLSNSVPIRHSKRYFYLRHERVTKKMTIIVSDVSVCYTFFREK